MLIKIISLAILIGTCIWVIRLFASTATPKNQCPRCEGKGYWLGTRERERCDWCGGSGELPSEQ